MPPPLAVDREQAKMLATTHGVREAARMIGMKECTLMQWSARGKWFAKAPEPILPPTMRAVQPVNEQGVSDVSKPSEALLNSLEDQSKRSKVALSKASMKAAEHAAELNPEDILKSAKNLKEISAIASNVHNWQASQAAVAVQVNLMGTDWQ